MKEYNIVGAKRLTDEAYAKLKRACVAMMGPMPKRGNRIKAEYKKTLYKLMEAIA